MRRSPAAFVARFFWLAMFVTTNAYAQISDSPGSVNCPPAVDLTVTVTISGGSVIPNALVILREDTLGQPRRVKVFEQLRTDQNGKATAEVPCSYLDVFVAHDGFAPAARRFLITKDTHTVSIPLEAYPITRTTAIPAPEILPDRSPMASTTPESAQSPTQSDPTFYIAKPTILAFFEPLSQTSQKDDVADSNEALADFQFYGRQVRKPPAKIGVDYKEIYASRFVVKLGDTPTTFQPAKGIGYYFVAPGKKPCVEYGVMTDSDLLNTAHNCFGVTGKQ